jgi:hypothetical protein
MCVEGEGVDHSDCMKDLSSRNSKAGNVHKMVTMWCVDVTTVDVEMLSI